MAELEVGKKAPSFTLKDTNDGKVTLKDDVRGHWAVLYFYPKDMTPGCTKQACSFRDHWATLKKRKVKVYGFSPDSTARHQKFTEKYDLPFPLLVDPDKAALPVTRISRRTGVRPSRPAPSTGRP